MINAIASSSVVGPETARRGGDNFSYAMAATATRDGAAKALKSHGATPASPQNSAPPAAKPQAGETSRARSAPRVREDAPAQRPHVTAQTPAQNAPRMITPPAPALAATGASINAPALASGPAIARGGLPQNSLMALKEQTAAKATRAANAPDPTQNPQRAATEEFARILALRLADQTSFDIDLEIEGLGRVEGRLILGDDGAGSLSLAFDRPETLDQFMRDGEALRAHLEASGFAFGERDISFALRESPGAKTPLQVDHAEEPRRLIAGGAIDILI